MPRRGPVLLALTLDPASSAPLFRQVYDGLRTAILAGRLSPGTRLPASRALACELGVSRNTILNAYDQLLAEGYLEGRFGSGTYVPHALPDDLLRAGPAPAPVRLAAGSRRSLSQRGALLARATVSLTESRSRLRPFRPGEPSFDDFPFELWSRLVARRWRRPPTELLTYGDPAGYRPLRDAIAQHVQAARGVCCTTEQVIIVTGSQQGLDLTARVLLDPGDAAWLEDPMYHGTRGAFQGAGIRVVSVPVDGDGLNVAAGERLCPDARLAYVTPSHQYPLGVVMSLPRRLALLDWASRAAAWVLEDDYDSEFRYAGRPLAALQGLDRAGRVIYLGTFSKVLFPSLRLGYLIVPPDLAAAFTTARAAADRFACSLTQAVVADFITEGHFARHIRRMRMLYAARQESLIRAARRELGGMIDVGPSETGMHLIGWLADGVDDRQVSTAAQAAGVEAPPLSAYRVEPGRSGLLLGYAAYDVRPIREGVRRLAEAVRQLPRS